MRSVVARRFGGPEVLEVLERARPEPGPGEARVRVLAAGVAYPDLLMREGAYLGGPQAPFTPGYDIVGRVDALGPGTAGAGAGPQPGQTVAALIEHGGYAEHVCVPGPRLVPVPDGLDPAEAVSLVLNYTTAWQALFRAGGSRKGERVLVHGAGGGVGTAALQIGRIQGLDTYGTASASKREVVERLGGTHIDYRAEDFGRRLRELTGDGVDVVLDAIGGRVSLRSFRVLRRGGRLVLFGHHSVLSGGRRRRGRMTAWYASVAAVWLAGMVDPRRTVRGYRIQKLAVRRPGWFREDLGRLFGLLAERRIEPLVAGRLPLEEARRAHELLADARVEGKLVLIPDAAALLA
jgi:NADPH:quinone reductase-like Zn-dependent oxidoreductase